MENFGRIQITSLAEFGEMFQTDPEWLIPEWLPDSQLVLLVGPPKKCKSFLTVELSVAISTGASFMGHNPTRTGPVIFLQLEDPPSVTRQRFDLILASKAGRTEKDPTLREGAPVHVMLPEGQFHLSSDLDSLEELIKLHRPVLITIDSLYACVDLSDFGVSGVAHIKALKSLCVKYSVTVVLVHHAKKSAGRGAEGLFGTQLLNAVCDGGIHIRSMEMEDGQDMLTCLRIWRAAEAPDTEELVVNICTLPSDYHYDSFTRALPENPRTSDTNSHDTERHHGIPGLR